MKKVLIAIAAIVLFGCGRKVDTPIADQILEKGSAPRIKVTRIGVIEDDIAYGSKRGVYVIQDTKTGQEFIGVSGIGITETSAHTVSNGKTSSTYEDER